MLQDLSYYNLQINGVIQVARILQKKKTQRKLQTGKNAHEKM